MDRVKPTRICPAGSEVDYSQLENKPLIIKPHGTFEDEKSETIGANPDVVLMSQQIGLAPDLQTERCLIHFTRGKCLLVAGYSDDDVDIFPIFQDLYPEDISTMFWMEHTSCEEENKFFKWWFEEGGHKAEEKTVKKHLHPIFNSYDIGKTEEGRKAQEKKLERKYDILNRRRGLAKWLVERSPESIIFLGDVRELWGMVFAQLKGIPFQRIDEDSKNKVDLGLDFLVSPQNLPHTALLMSHLLEDSGERNFSVNGLLKNLHRGGYFATDPVKKLFMLSRYSSGLYVISDWKKCSRLIREIEELIRDERSFGQYGKYYRAEGTAQIAFLEIFHFKMLKKPEVFNPIHWLIALWRIIKGRRLLHLTEEMFSQLKKTDFPGVGLDYGSGKHRSKDPRWIIYFYLGDIFHSVARFLHFLFGLRTKICKPLLKKAESHYENAMEIRGDPSTFDFYRLRLVEVQFLLGKELDWEFLEKRVRLSHENYRRLGNDQQIGYTNVVLAMIEFKKGGDRKKIKRLLSEARKTFKESDSSRAVNLVKWFSKILGVDDE